MNVGRKAQDWEQCMSDAFRRLFDRILYRTDINLRRQAFTILNIGCGNGRETMDMRAACLIREIDCRIYAVDCDEDAIEVAKKSYTNSDTVFIADNAADPTMYTRFPDRADVVILRQPEVTTYSPTDGDFFLQKYERILKLALAKARKDGKLVVTTYNAIEYQIMLKILSSIPTIAMVQAEANPYRDQSLERENIKAKVIDCPDQYVIVATIN